MKYLPADTQPCRWSHNHKTVPGTHPRVTDHLLTENGVPYFDRSPSRNVTSRSRVTLQEVSSVRPARPSDVFFKKTTYPFVSSGAFSFCFCIVSTALHRSNTPDRPTQPWGGGGGPQPCRECLGVVAFVFRRNRRVDEALTRLDLSERLEEEVAALKAARAGLLDRALAAEVG